MLFMLMTLFPVFTGMAQNLLPVKSYFHLTGKIGGSVSVTVDLVKDRDSLYASLSLRSESYTSSNYNIWYSNPKELTGKMRPDGTLWLKEVFSEGAPLLTGQMTGNGSIRGQWNSVADRQKLPVELNESYPDGSVPFSVYSIKGSKPLTRKANSQRGKIALLMLLPEESGNPLLSDSLKSLIIREFTGRQENTESPEILLEQARDSYFENYISSNQPLLGEFPDAPSLNWEMLKFMHILNNRGHQLTFYILTYAFTGGAHGLETQEFRNMDLKTGKSIALRELLKPGYEEALSLLLTKKLHQIKKIPDNQKLTDAGYFTDLVKPTDNFYLTENGIGFYYNHYDIAPYSFGSSDLFLTFDEVKGLMK
jgi:hypothetical protein